MALKAVNCNPGDRVKFLIEYVKHDYSGAKGTKKMEVAIGTIDMEKGNKYVINIESPESIRKEYGKTVSIDKNAILGILKKRIL